MRTNRGGSAITLDPTWPQSEPLPNFNKHEDAVRSAVFSPDGTRVLTTSGDTIAKLWDVNGKLLADLNKHMNEVKNAEFSPDGNRILTVS